MGNGQEINSAPATADTGAEGLSERLIFLLSDSKFGVFDIDINKRAVLIDDRWANMLGYNLDELSPMTFKKFNSLVHPEDIERAQAMLSDQFTGVTTLPYDTEVRLQHKDGSWRWIRSRGKVTKYSPDGKPLMLTGINEDITEERRRDLELHVSRQQLQAAQRIAGVGSWFLDLATDTVTWSKELYLMQGLDPHEPPPPATTHEQLFNAESWERLSAALTATRLEGTPYELELKMEREGKFFGWMLARGEAVFDSDGNIVGIQGVALDISDREATIFDISAHGIGCIISEPIVEIIAIGSRVPITVALPNGDVANGTLEIRSLNSLNGQGWRVGGITTWADVQWLADFVPKGNWKAMVQATG